MQKTVGERPLGWYCRYGPSVNTRRLVVEEGGFLYDSDAYNDELPYWVRVGNKAHLVVPYSLTANDSKFGAGGFFTASDYFTFVKDGFDMLYREGRTQPKMMSLGLHLRLIGHPSRADGLRWLHAGRVLVRGRAVPLVGSPSLEHTRVDLTAVPDAAVGDEVVIIGRQGDEAITPGEVAAHQGLSQHHIATTVGPRVTRLYRGQVLHSDILADI